MISPTPLPKKTSNPSPMPGANLLKCAPQSIRYSNFTPLNKAYAYFSLRKRLGETEGQRNKKL